MTETDAIQLIGEMCVRTMGLALLTVERTVSRRDARARAYIAAQREWYERMQDRLNVEIQVDEALRGL